MEKLIILIIFVGFSMVRGLIKSANEKAQREQRLAQRADPNRKRKVQGEIEAFLSEVGGGKDQAPPRGDAATQRRNERRQRLQEEKARARRDQQERRRQAEIQQKREATRKRRQAEDQATNSPERKVGSGISEHVDQYINKHVAEHIDDDIEEYVEATIVDSVEDNLGARNVEMPNQPTTTHAAQSPAAKAVRALLQDKTGVRNAILVNEILSRPRSLRR